MRKFKSQMLSLAADVFAYSLAAGLYLLVRFWGTQDTIDWATSTHALVLLWLVIGLTFGVFYWLLTFLTESQKLRQKSYIFIIAFKTAGIILITCLIVLLSRFAAYLEGSIALNQVFPTFLTRMTHRAVFAFFTYVISVCVIYSFIKQMKFMIGGRVLFNLMRGKYHDPLEEERIFMFLDLKHSTAYAERLGHNTFCKLIQDCFNDLTNSAIKHRVEIYQYVGDEAILTWLLKDGLADNNCIDVFFDFDMTIRSKFKYYGYTYGLVPEFKAGVNLGPVTAAEVGIMKRSIAYLSDVLNTASRIQEKCNEFNKKLLISGELRQHLQDSAYKYERMGQIALRGKEKGVDIYSVEKP